MSSPICDHYLYVQANEINNQINKRFPPFSEHVAMDERDSWDEREMDESFKTKVKGNNNCTKQPK